MSACVATDVEGGGGETGGEMYTPGLGGGGVPCPTLSPKPTRLGTFRRQQVEK